MSYILSALKKADQERKSGDIPDVFSPDPKITIETSSSWAINKVYFVIIGILLLGLIAAWVFYWSNTTSVPRFLDSPTRFQDFNPATPLDNKPIVTKPQQLTQPPKSPAPQLPAEQKPDLSSFPGPFSRGLQPSEQPSVQQPRLPVFSQEVLDYNQLSESVQDSLPTLQLTGHLYSAAQTRARKVIINGVALRENQYIQDDLIVQEILIDGVVLNFQGQLFKIYTDQMFQ